MNVGALLGSLGRDVGPLGSEAVALNLHTVFFAGRRGLPKLRKCAAFGGTGGRLGGALVFGAEQQGSSDKNSPQQNNEEKAFALKQIPSLSWTLDHRLNQRLVKGLACGKGRYGHLVTFKSWPLRSALTTCVFNNIPEVMDNYLCFHGHSRFVRRFSTPTLCFQ